jgi:hypothetical protein
LHRSTRFARPCSGLFFYTLFIRSAFVREIFLRMASANRRFLLKTFGAHLAAMHHSSVWARLARIIVLVLRFCGGAFGIAVHQAQNSAHQ